MAVSKGQAFSCGKPFRTSKAVFTSGTTIAQVEIECDSCITANKLREAFYASMIPAKLSHAKKGGELSR